MNERPELSYQEEENLEIGRFTLSDAAMEHLLRALSRGTPLERFATGLREAIQNGVDASLKRSEESGGAASRLPLEVSVEGEDVVVRDHGIGLRPSEINTLILSIFSSGKEEGAGGFGAGATSIMLASPEVVIRSRKEGFRGAEFRRSWLGKCPPKQMDNVESNSFPIGTEIRMSGVIGQKINEWSTLSEKMVRQTFAVMLQTSQWPQAVDVRINGAAVEPLFDVGGHSRKVEPDIPNSFAGAEVEFHVIPLAPEGERPEFLERPRTFIQLSDPKSGRWSLTQMDEHLDDSVQFHLIVRVRPLVRPNHDDYPFNPERSAIAVRVIREAINEAKQRFVTDRLTALKQQTWDRFLYAGEEEQQMDPLTRAMREVAQMPESISRLQSMLEAIEQAGLDARVPNTEGYGLGGDTEQVIPESIAGEASMVMVHRDFQTPEFMGDFDPRNPDDVRRLTPLLLAMRTIGRLVRSEAGKVRTHPFASPYQEPPYYGFIFSPTEEAVLETDSESRLGKDTRFVLLNPASEALRTAQSSEALCDMVIARLLHEHCHEAEPSHWETFTTLYGAIDDRLSNIRSRLHEVFHLSGAWEAMCDLQGRPVEVSGKGRSRKARDRGLLPMPEKEIVRFTLDPDLSVQEMRFLQRLAQFADQTKDRHAAAYGVQDLLQSLNTCHLISDDSLQKIQKVVRKMGVRPEKYRDVFMPADEKSPRSEDVLRFQMEVLDLYHRDYVVQSTLKEVQGAEEVDVEKTVEFFRTSHLSLPQLHTLTYYTDETFYGYGEFRHYQAAMRSLGTGQSLEVARTQAESELDAIDDSWARRYPVLRGGDMETVLLLSAVKGREPVWEGEQKAEALRAIQAYLSHGTAPAAYLKGVRRVEQGSLFGG